jgi:hypothetical protein
MGASLHELSCPLFGAVLLLLLLLGVAMLVLVLLLLLLLLLLAAPQPAWYASHTIQWSSL